MKGLIKSIIVDFIDRNLPVIKDRDIDIPIDSGKIISIVGARRTGKTYLLYWLIAKMRKNIPRHRIIYINFEDDRLFPANLQTLDNFLKAYWELYPDNKNKKVYFFFDEIQVIENWELFIRRIYDSENCSIFITGSSSKLMIGEISTALRGRSISYELFPLSFTEYLSFKKIDYDKYATKSNAKVVNAFEQYSTTTAFPELIDMNEELRNRALGEYLDLVIYKDIVERYHVSNIYLMKYLIKFLFSNSANLISINKIYNELKTLGLSISRNSVYEYISYLEDSYTIFSSPLYTHNLREQQRNPKKFYALDIGLRNVMAPSVDKGKILESIVYSHLRRNTDKVFYYQTDQEVDFIELKGHKFNIINVCYDLTSVGTKKREIDSLLKAMRKLKKNTAYLLTSDLEGEEMIDTFKILMIPVWKWILEQM